MAMHIPHNPDYARIDPVHNAGHSGRYDPHGPDRFRYSPPARQSFRNDQRGDWRGHDSNQHHTGSPGNWGWDHRTHLGNDQHHSNAPRNHWGEQPQHPSPGGNRGHEGHGHVVHRQPDHHVDYRPNHYGGRSYSYGPSRNRHSR